MKYSMIRFGQTTLVVALACSFGLSTAVAQPGAAPAGTAIAEYNGNTGEVIVSVSAVQNWVLSSNSGSLTGPDTALDVLPAGGGLSSENDFNVGELLIGGNLEYTNLNLGAVAATALPAESLSFPSNSTDLFIFWNPTNSDLPGGSQPVVCVAGCTLDMGGGDFDGDGDVDGDDFKLWQRGGSPSPLSPSDLALWEEQYGDTSSAANLATVPEPTSVALIALGLCGVLGTRRRS